MEKRRTPEKEARLKQTAGSIGLALMFYTLLLALSALLTVRGVLKTDMMERCVLLCAVLAVYAGVLCGAGKGRSLGLGALAGAALFALCAVLGVLIYPDASLRASAWQLALAMIAGGTLAGWKRGGRRIHRRRAHAGHAR